MGAALGRSLNATVIVLGLENSGKTAVVNWMKKMTGDDTTAADVPSVGLRIQTIQANSLQMTICDASGKLRALWERLYRRCDGIVFVLDSSDPLRLAVVRDELRLMLSHKDLERKPVPILFLANKKDLGEAVDCTSCTTALGLDDIHDRPWKIYSSNALSGEGLGDAIDWFTGEVKNFLKRS